MTEITYKFGGKNVVYRDFPEGAERFLSTLKSFGIVIVSVSYCLVLT